MVGAHAARTPALGADGPRPVNLRTDLGPLADLLEVAFAANMDSQGRAAVREMRAHSQLPLISLLGGMNQLMQGMGQGFVWVADGRLVGNVSIYPADGPGNDRRTWVIVNVSVHPEYQRRGIAYHLMRESMAAIQRHSGHSAILQVDTENSVARRLYIRLGFREERSWITWRRTGSSSLPPPFDAQPRPQMSHRRPGEWAAEMALAAIVRPASYGGVGWLRPLHEHVFQPPLLKRLGDLISLRSIERLVIRSGDAGDVLASLWVDHAFGMACNLTLMVHPDYEGLYDEVLLNTAVRRFGRSTLLLEHPGDRTVAAAVLRRYQFSPRRDVVHMRWSASEAGV